MKKTVSAVPAEASWMSISPRASSFPAAPRIAAVTVILIHEASRNGKLCARAR